jgi:hypothetical protein
MLSRRHGHAESEALRRLAVVLQGVGHGSGSVDQTGALRKTEEGGGRDEGKEEGGGVG